MTQYKRLIYKIVEYINSYKSEEAAQKFCEEFMDLFFETQNDLEKEVSRDIYEMLDDLNLVCDSYELNEKIREMDKYCIDHISLYNRVMEIYKQLIK